MNEMIERGLVAMGLPTINNYFWVKYLDNDRTVCSFEWRNQLESAIIIELRLKELGWN